MVYITHLGKFEKANYLVFPQKFTLIKIIRNLNTTTKKDV